MTKIYSSLALLIIISVSCNNSTSSDPEFNYNKISTTNDTIRKDSQSIIPQSKIETTTVPSAAKQNNVSTNGLNPEHGKPGHRCDLAVGAPLNSKPVSTPIQPQATQPIQTQTQTVSTNKTVTPPGMNPPHGEPGHRCDITVGSPLNQPVKNPEPKIKSVSPEVKDSAKK